MLATAGSFSAISALFGGPLVAGMLMVEGGLGMGPALLPDAAARPGGGGDRLRVVRRARRLGRSRIGRAVVPRPSRVRRDPRHRSRPRGRDRDRHRAARRRCPARGDSAWTRRRASDAGAPARRRPGGRAARAARPSRSAAIGTRRSSPASPRCPNSSPKARSAIVAARADHEGDRLRDLPRLRLPRRPGVPGDLPRRRRGDDPRDRVRHVADGGGRDRHRRRHGGR